jgi:plasmid stabilization system protein ParE
VPRSAWSPKRERQYEHIKDSLHERGYTDANAEEIAARTVNKERARHGETVRLRSRSGARSRT